MSKRILTMTHENGFEVKVEVDDAWRAPEEMTKGLDRNEANKLETAQDIMRETLEFFVSGKENIKTHGLEKAFMRSVLLICWRLKLANYNLSHRDYLAEIEDTEGWWELDGRYGVKLINIDDEVTLDMDACEFTEKVVS